MTTRNRIARLVYKYIDGQEGWETLDPELQEDWQRFADAVLDELSRDDAECLAIVSGHAGWINSPNGPYRLIQDHDHEGVQE